MWIFIAHLVALVAFVGLSGWLRPGPPPWPHQWEYLIKHAIEASFWAACVFWVVAIAGMVVSHGLYGSSRPSASGGAGRLPLLGAIALGILVLAMYLAITLVFTLLFGGATAIAVYLILNDWSRLRVATLVILGTICGVVAFVPFEFWQSFGRVAASIAGGAGAVVFALRMRAADGARGYVW